MWGFPFVSFRTALGFTSSPRCCMPVICFNTSAIFQFNKSKRV
jgi:hypothetical protein